MNIKLPSPIVVETVQKERYNTVLEKLIEQYLQQISECMSRGIYVFYILRKDFENKQSDICEVLYDNRYHYVNEQEFLDAIAQRVEADGVWMVVTDTIWPSDSTVKLRLEFVSKPKLVIKPKWWNRIFK